MLTNNMKITDALMVMAGGFTPAASAAGAQNGSAIDMGAMESVAAILSVGSPVTGNVVLKAQASVDTVSGNFVDIPGKTLSAVSTTDKVGILNVRASDVSNILNGAGVPCRYVRFVSTTTTGPITDAVIILGGNFRNDPPTAFKASNVAEIV